MNYNNFKRHQYEITMLGERAGKERGVYNRIYCDVRRDGPYPIGEKVTDYYEVKYACKVKGFDFNSIDWDSDAELTLKRDSKEWVKFVKDPGVPFEEHLTNFFNEHVTFCQSDDEHVYIPLDLIYGNKGPKSHH